MLASLLNDTLGQFDSSEAFMRLKELHWDASRDADFDIDREAFTSDGIANVLQGLAVALYAVEGQIGEAYADQVWWLLQHCGVALDILDGIDMWVRAGHYVPGQIRQTLRADWQAMKDRVEARSKVVGVHTIADQLRMRRRTIRPC